MMSTMVSHVFSLVSLDEIVKTIYIDINVIEKRLNNDIFVEHIETMWHIYASADKGITVSDNGLLSVRRQDIISSNAGLLLNEHSWKKFSKILINIHTFSFKKMH